MVCNKKQMKKKRQQVQQAKINKKVEWTWKKKTFYITTAVTVLSSLLTAIVTLWVSDNQTGSVIYNGDVITYQMFGDAVQDVGFTEEEKIEAYNVSVGKSIAIFATEYCVGKPYVYGGTSLTAGADASGLLVSVYEKYGIELPHSSMAIAGMGEEVNLADIRDGDVVCYDGHVGIYVGENLVVHASNDRSGIIISDMYYREPITIRRFNFAEVGGKDISN